MTPSDVIYAVQATEGRRVQDWCAYLMKEDTTWRLAAVRTLALPPLFFILLDSLEATRRLPDSAGRTLENMRLTASPDSGLKTFFAERRAALESIADGFSRETARSIAAAPDGLKAPTPALRSLATAQTRGSVRIRARPPPPSRKEEPCQRSKPGGSRRLERWQQYCFVSSCCRSWFWRCPSWRSEHG
jgi:hypothetical protein